MSEEEKELLKSQLGEDISIFESTCKNVENMHEYNKHKYLGCSPSVHLDVLHTNFKNG